MQISKYLISKLNQYRGCPTIVEERDACGVGFLAHVNQFSSHLLIEQALDALKCMEHRGACGADGVSGDGAGITTQIPWSFFLKYLGDKSLLKNLQVHNLALGMVFFPQERLTQIKDIFQWILEQYDCQILAWRVVPTNKNLLGKYSLKSKPDIQQCIVYSKVSSGDDLEKKL